MELKTLDNKPKVGTNTDAILKTLRTNTVKSTPFKNPVLAEIKAESGEVVYGYLEKFKVTQSQHILFLPLVRHYLYDSEELKQVDTIVNFKLLNRIPHIRYFLVTMNRLLPINGQFVGCFLDYKKQKQRVLEAKHSLLGYLFLMSYVFVNRTIPQIPVINKVQHLLNHGKVKCLAKDEARVLLEKNGFKIINMTEIDGLTYFISQKVSHSKKETVSLLTLFNNFKIRLRITNV